MTRRCPPLEPFCLVCLFCVYVSPLSYVTVGIMVYFCLFCVYVGPLNSVNLGIMVYLYLFCVYVGIMVYSMYTL